MTNSFTYRMFEGSPGAEGQFGQWPQFLPQPTPGEQLVHRLRNRIRYGGRKGRRAARRLEALRDQMFG